MKTITDIAASFEALKPAIAADFTAFVTERLNQLVAKYPGSIEKLYSQWGRDADAYRSLRHMLKGLYEHGVPVSVDADAVAKEAKRYADDQIAAFTLKLTRKLGNLTNVEIFDIDTGRFEFTIQGHAGDRLVRVEQGRIINTSPKGKLFHQWPARIYVDGKLTPEAKFKAIAA